MPLFAISFRIFEDSTYQERHNCLVGQILKEAVGDIGDTWDETASFFVIRSNKLSKSLCDDLYMSAKMSEQQDVLLVINLSEKGYAHRGIRHPKIFRALMTRQ